jgi:BTB/POZ domain
MDNPDSLTTRIAALSVADSATDSTTGGGSDSGEVHAFSIICSDGQTLAVPEQDARMVLSSCEYFCNMFSHNTVESASRIIRKPDWSYEVAKHVIEYLLHKTCRVSVEHGADVLAALDQAQLSGVRMRPPHFIQEGFGNEQAHVISMPRIMRHAIKLPLEFQIAHRMEKDRWLKLLSIGVVAVDAAEPWMDINDMSYKHQHISNMAQCRSSATSSERHGAFFGQHCAFLCSRP